MKTNVWEVQFDDVKELRLLKRYELLAFDVERDMNYWWWDVRAAQSPPFISLFQQSTHFASIGMCQALFKFLGRDQEDGSPILIKFIFDYERFIKHYKN